MTRINPGENLGIACRRTGWRSCGKRTLDRIAKVNHLDKKRTVRAGRKYHISPREVTAIEHRIRMLRSFQNDPESKRLEKLNIIGLYGILTKYNPKIDGIPVCTESFVHPLKNVKYQISDQFGYRIHPILHKRKFHFGQDIGIPSGTPLYATNSAKVLYSNCYSVYGNLLVLVHQTKYNKYYTVYAHNSKNLVKEGDIISRNQLIAFSGNSGRVTAAHLHFEFRNALGKAFNPEIITEIDINSREIITPNSSINNNFLDLEFHDEPYIEKIAEDEKI